VAVLESHLALFSAPGPNGRVFTGERSAILRKTTIDRNWRLARKAVRDLPAGFHFHDLRHTANTLAASTGASTAELMHRMGHASSAAALRYQHATKDRDVEVAQLIDTFVTSRARTSSVQG
jgi:integrase